MKTVYAHGFFDFQTSWGTPSVGFAATSLQEGGFKICTGSLLQRGARLEGGARQGGGSSSRYTFLKNIKIFLKYMSDYHHLNCIYLQTRQKSKTPDKNKERSGFISIL